MNNKKKILISVLAITLTLFASTGVTLAYFSDYETAMGEVTIHLNGQTQSEEEVTDTEKVICVVNTGQPGDANMVVRVRVTGPEGMKITIQDQLWEKHGDFYYYGKALKPGEKTGTLTASVNGIPVTADLTAFDITVHQESAYATYGTDNIIQKPEGWDYIPVIKAEE